MKKTFEKIFQKDPAKLKEMLSLVEQGYSYLSIARRYKVDHSTIIWHARKLGIPSRRKNLIKELRKPKEPKEEKINPGLPSYKEYLQVEKEKNKNKTLEEIIEIYKTKHK